jgi:hypothetical protein
MTSPDTPVPVPVPAPAQQLVPGDGYRPLRQLTIVLECVFAAWLVVAAVAIAFRLSERSLLHRIMSHPFSVSRSDAIASDDRIHALGLLVIGGLVVTGVLFIAWFRRAYQNTAAFGAPRRSSTGWAVGGWFVPIANFFIPKRIANDIWRGSEPHGLTGPDQPVPTVLNVWWGSWVALNLAARFGTSGGRVSSAQDALGWNLGAIVMFALLAASALFAVAVVRAVDQRQAARSVGLGTNGAGR